MEKRFLYRGDQHTNSNTMPGKYRSLGLVRKIINGGSSAYIQREGLLNTITAHIDPRTIWEKDFHQKSEFISFSSDIDKAKYYCSKYEDKYFPENLIQCEEYYETRYIFTLDISNKIPIGNNTGIYLLRYKCNPELRKSDGLNEGVIEFHHQIKWTECPICPNNKYHEMVIIDSVKFLENNQNYSVNTNSLKNAKRDKEWLILPRDFSNELGDYSSFIPRSAIWTVEHYRLDFEKRRDPSLYAIQGMIFDENED